MKKWLCFFLCVLCLTALTSVAMAAERSFADVPQDQLNLILPKGLRVNQSCADGQLTLAVDDAATDWAQALATTGGNGATVEALWQVTMPAGMEAPRFVYMLYPIYDEAEVQEAFDMAEAQHRLTPVAGTDGWNVPHRPDYMPITEKALQIGRPILEAGMMVPQEDDFWVYLGWYDDQQQPVLYQKVHISLTHSKTAAFKTQLSKPVPAERIMPAGNAAVVDRMDGQITYKDVTPGTEYVTGVQAPQGACYYQQVSGLKDLTGSSQLQPVPGNQLIQQTVIHREGMPANHAYTYSYLFYDASQQLMQVETLRIAQQTGDELLPWLAYCFDTFPFTADQLVVENGCEDSGYVIAYDEATGHFTCRFDGETGKDGPSKPGKVKLSIVVPQWAVGYRMHTVASNSLLGPGSGSLAGLEYELDQGYPNGFEAVTPGQKITLSYEPFKTVKPEDNDLTLYVPDTTADVPYAADLCVVQWLDDEGIVNNPCYFWRTTESFVVAETEKPVIQKKDLDKMGQVTEPTLVVPNGKPFEDCKLLFSAYYTESASEWHYELTMVDSDGNPIQPGNHGSNVWVYLPFPEGHQSGQKYKLNHYLKGLYTGSDLSAQEELAVEETLYGLMFETDSFSPFILSKSEDAPEETPPPDATEPPVPTQSPAPTQSPDATEPPVPTQSPMPTQSPVQQPPKAGDTTPICWLAGLMLLSAAGMLLLRRRAAR